MARRFPCYVSKARRAVFELAEGSCFHSSRAQLTAASSPSSCSSWPEQLQVSEAKLGLLCGRERCKGQHRAVHVLPGARELGWGQAQPLPALSSSTGSNIGRSQPGVGPAAAQSSLPIPVTPSLGALRIPVGAFPALAWMDLDQNLSSSIEPILLNQGFQHLELLGLSRSWTWRCGASLSWLHSTGSMVG